MRRKRCAAPFGLLLRDKNRPCAVSIRRVHYAEGNVLCALQEEAAPAQEEDEEDREAARSRWAVDDEGKEGADGEEGAKKRSPEDEALWRKAQEEKLEDERKAEERKRQVRRPTTTTQSSATCLWVLMAYIFLCRRLPRRSGFAARRKRQLLGWSRSRPS